MKPSRRGRAIAGLLLFSALSVAAFDGGYFTPAGDRPAITHIGAAGILPGGRIVAPLGEQLVTGPGAFSLAISPSGKTIVTSNIGPERFSLTVAEREKKGIWSIHNLAARRPREQEDLDEKFELADVDDKEWRTLFIGLAFAGEKTVWASEGNSGRVRLMDLTTGTHKKLVGLNVNGFSDSFTGDLAYDARRGLVFVLDMANFRMAAIDTHRDRVLSSIAVGRLPFSIALAPDGRTVYVANIGMLQYQVIPQADRARARETGLTFPAFGFPSPEALAGARRQTGTGQVDVPGLGDPNADAANSVCVINVENAETPRVEKFIRTGVPFGAQSAGGSGPSSVLAAAGHVFVSNVHDDTITVIDPAKNAVTGHIPIGIPGLESLRGVMPLGMAYDETKRWLLVAEAGINAVGVVDVEKMAVIAHLPAGWFPARVAVRDGTAYVANARGQGTGPRLPHGGFFEPGGFENVLHSGTVGTFPLPAPAELPKLTGTVFSANGFFAKQEPPPAIPSEIQHVVLIVKENRTFDEVFGDIASASNGAVAGYAKFARFGEKGYAAGDGKRFSVHNASVTPNHHAMAAQWSFSDNFYADSEVSVDGHHWLVGAVPDAWTESSLMASYTHGMDFRLTAKSPGRLTIAESNASVQPHEQGQAGTLWHHLARYAVPFRNFGEGFELPGIDESAGLEPTGARFLTNVPMPEPLYRNTSREYPGFNMNIPDQFRATQFIHEVEARYGKGGAPLPQFVYIHLPNDHMTAPRPGDGYPYSASYVADNDYALGRIVEYLSHSPWWKSMAIFVTEDDAQGGYDHIDSHRTLLMAIGPYCRKNFVLHRNSSFPGLLKTIFQILHLPPLNLFDATAADLAGVFTREPDFTSYQLRGEDPRIFVPGEARAPLDPKPSVRMDSR